MTSERADSFSDVQCIGLRFQPHRNAAFGRISVLERRYKGMVESIGGYILEQSVSVRAAPELIVADGGAAVEFFDKASSPFCIPGARQC